ncbi:MAG TPA: tetratricopeptide repeat protein, partial [Gammaproteobacteria bacterium]|nr:tetratricopeptide repeat protein [Gammaproteobacteria bacterium]
AEPGQFAGRIAEIKGDIHAGLGETDAARTAYLEAMVAPGAELLDRGFLQMKLSDLPGSAPAAPPASPDAAANPAAAPAEGAQTAPAKPAEGA